MAIVYDAIMRKDAELSKALEKMGLSVQAVVERLMAQPDLDTLVYEPAKTIAARVEVPVHIYEALRFHPDFVDMMFRGVMYRYGFNIPQMIKEMSALNHIASDTSNPKTMTLAMRLKYQLGGVLKAVTNEGKGPRELAININYAKDRPAIAITDTMDLVDPEQSLN